MKNQTIMLVSLCLISCGGGISNYSVDLSSGYQYGQQGEGLNIITGGPKTVKSIAWVKKYHDNGKYISIWQADSAQINSENFRYGSHPKDTYFLNDRFYIIDLKNEKLLGPFKAEEFFSKARDLRIEIHWEPQMVYD